jgi:tetratricopeptide (TPR) repeat protein
VDDPQAVRATRGGLPVRHGTSKESIPYLERSLRLNANDAITHLYYGRGLMFTGRPEPAIAHFERFERLNPTDRGSHMAQMYHSLGLVFSQRWKDAERVAREGIAAAGGQNGWTWVALIVALGAWRRISTSRSSPA